MVQDDSDSRDRRVALLGEILVECEDVTNALDVHDDEARAIDKAQTATIRFDMALDVSPF